MTCHVTKRTDGHDPGTPMLMAQSFFIHSTSLRMWGLCFYDKSPYQFVAGNPHP